jgi:hypothetical protein
MGEIWKQTKSCQHIKYGGWLPVLKTLPAAAAPVIAATALAFHDGLLQPLAALACLLTALLCKSQRIWPMTCLIFKGTDTNERLVLFG